MSLTIEQKFNYRKFYTPYVNIKITREDTTPEQKAELINEVTDLLDVYLIKHPRLLLLLLTKWTWKIGGLEVFPLRCFVKIN